ncbi:MAG: hypothetical protein WCO09_01550 [bacterium]
MNRTKLATCILILFALSFKISFAQISATVNISDTSSMELRVVYPVNNNSNVSVLSSSNGKSTLEEFRTLKSAYGSDGTSRQINSDNPGSDAKIIVDKNDTYVGALYKIDNALKDGNVGVFGFPLIIKTVDAKNFTLKINSSDSLDVLSYPGTLNSKSLNTIETKIQFRDAGSGYSIANLLILVYKKDGSYVKKDIGPFSVVAPKSRIDRAYSDVVEISSSNKVYQEIFGLSLPTRVNIVAVSLKNISLASYDAEGLTLSPNIVFINTDSFAYYVPTLVSRKVLVHELAHATINAKAFFNYNTYNATWLNEGLATFAEQYITDSYLSKESNNDNKQQHTNVHSYEKLSRDNLKSEYKLPFDFNFRINNKVQTIDKTYSHSGLIFYNLFLTNRNIIPNLISYIRSSESQPSCSDCDTNKIINKISSLSGLSREDIIYPFKNKLDSPSSVLDILTNNPVLAQPSSVNGVKAALSNKESSESTSSKTSTTTIESQDKIEGQIVPDEKAFVGTSTQKDSFTEKIKGWFMVLYDFL